ncbi:MULTISPECIES: PhoH family protein [unclassified Exiguobacterium]|uniref:PhoH family protein n=1 Tax=unclassified Exiguobacterium TaxID=2644629 RepID=UPI0020367CD7|nr:MULTISPECIES: PhoH family protein [unclassified Exiguobacterium]
MHPLIMTDKIPFVMEHANEAQALLGPKDEVFQAIETELKVALIPRGEELIIQADTAETLELTKQVIITLQTLVKKGARLNESDAISVIQHIQVGKGDELLEHYERVVFTTNKGKPIRAKTVGQSRYVRAIERRDLVFGIGPAGTGKTYLAVVLAARALKEGQVKRIILTRPAVEAGENLGFLPGDLKEKVDPYLRPLYDALFDVYGVEQTNRLLERGTIEVAPLAYMRGRTLEDAFVILDEAQNTTKEQMKMFLTRLGFGSKMVVTGDLTQVDLPKGKASGLQEALRLLEGVDGIHFEHFSASDVVRHPLVKKIINAYSTDLT